MGVKRLGLIPASMIQGAGQHQRVVRPKQPNRYVSFLLNQLGLKTGSRQARVGDGQRIRYYRIEPESYQRMVHYICQKAQGQGLNRVSQITGKLYKPEGLGRPPETFADWYTRRWRCKAKQRISAIDSAVQAFFADDVAAASAQAPPG